MCVHDNYDAFVFKTMFQQKSRGISNSKRLTIGRMRMVRRGGRALNHEEFNPKTVVVLDVEIFNRKIIKKIAICTTFFKISFIQ